jgi:hypothetical protein
LADQRCANGVVDGECRDVSMPDCPSDYDDIAQFSTCPTDAPTSLVCEPCLTPKMPPPLTLLSIQPPMQSTQTNANQTPTSTVDFATTSTDGESVNAESNVMVR